MPRSFFGKKKVKTSTSVVLTKSQEQQELDVYLQRLSEITENIEEFTSFIQLHINHEHKAKGDLSEALLTPFQQKISLLKAFIETANHILFTGTEDNVNQNSIWDNAQTAMGVETDEDFYVSIKETLKSFLKNESQNKEMLDLNKSKFLEHFKAIKKECLNLLKNTFHQIHCAILAKYAASVVYANIDAESIAEYCVPLTTQFKDLDRTIKKLQNVKNEFATNYIELKRQVDEIATKANQANQYYTEHFPQDYEVFCTYFRTAVLAMEPPQDAQYLLDKIKEEMVEFNIAQTKNFSDIVLGKITAIIDLFITPLERSSKYKIFLQSNDELKSLIKSIKKMPDELDLFTKNIDSKVPLSNEESKNIFQNTRKLYQDFIKDVDKFIKLLKNKMYQFKKELSSKISPNTNAKQDTEALFTKIQSFHLQNIINASLELTKQSIRKTSTAETFRNSYETAQSELKKELSSFNQIFDQYLNDEASLVTHCNWTTASMLLPPGCVKPENGASSSVANVADSTQTTTPGSMRP